jgi:hypothetical protein
MVRVGTGDIVYMNIAHLCMTKNLVESRHVILLGCSLGFIISLGATSPTEGSLSLSNLIV